MQDASAKVAMVLGCRYKQRGPEAEAADNVFHHLSYEGAARDIDAVADPRERAALEAQVQRLPACAHRVLLTMALLRP